MPFLLIIEPCGQVHRVFIGDQAGLLHEGLVLLIEDVIHQVFL